LAYWINRMQNGLTDQQLEAGFIGSAEYYTHSGGTNQLWIEAMYHDLLGRSRPGHCRLRLRRQHRARRTARAAGLPDLPAPHGQPKRGGLLGERLHARIDE